MDGIFKWGYILFFSLLLSIFLGFYVIVEAFFLLVWLGLGLVVIFFCSVGLKYSWEERKKIKNSVFNWHGNSAPTGDERQQSFVIIISYLVCGFFLYQYAPQYFEILCSFFKKVTAALTQ